MFCAVDCSNRWHYPLPRIIKTEVDFPAYEIAYLVGKLYEIVRGVGTLVVGWHLDLSRRLAGALRRTE